MIRRTHKKSRQGCAECKRCHKKCDESRPSCVNCTVTKKQCSYTRNDKSRSPADWEFVSSVDTENSVRSISPHLSLACNDLSSRPQPPPRAEPYVNLLHLELFQNVISNGICFPAKESLRDEWVAIVLQYTFSYPYLMYETLALSAFNLSIKHPSKADLYLTESTTLQAQALALFTSSTQTVDQDNLNAPFLFSALLGLHFFCDTFATPSSDLNTFLDRLVQSIQLLRGVDTIVGDSWEVIKNSDIKCLLQPDEPVIKRDDEVVRAFEDLCTSFSHSHTLSAFESRVYCESIEGLILVYNSHPPDATSDGTLIARTVTTWPITISAEYTELLNQRKPEALIVMAYFSIVLHSIREFWAVGDAGKFLLTAIEEYLGAEWVEWLAVPKTLVSHFSLDLDPGQEENTDKQMY